MNKIWEHSALLIHSLLELEEALNACTKKKTHKKEAAKAGRPRKSDRKVVQKNNGRRKKKGSIPVKVRAHHSK